ncbi:hypothetical protein PR048_031595 [Dryococelus australis]|uniref:Uncharacterized protein n=1 Tax=Dryococelus australis TaxID=614101 RepID=A0ABQ9G5R4_9NEOP|nr:hypothetical protein PR048_031595 [Dryococelus australis]
MRGLGKPGDPRENPPTSGIVRHDSRGDPAGNQTRSWSRKCSTGFRNFILHFNKKDHASTCRCGRKRHGSIAGIGAGMKGRVKREIPEKARRPTASSGTIPTCENPVTRPGIEPGSPWWEASVLIAQPPWSPKSQVITNCIVKSSFRNTVYYCYQSPVGAARAGEIRGRRPSGGGVSVTS